MNITPDTQADPTATGTPTAFSRQDFIGKTHDASQERGHRILAELALGIRPTSAPTKTLARAKTEAAEFNRD